MKLISRAMMAIFLPVAVQAAPDFVPGSFIVKLKDGVDAPKMAKDHGVTPDHFYSKALNGFAGKMSLAARSGMMKDKRLLHIEKDMIIKAIATVYNPTWGLDRIDQRALPLNASYNYNYTGRGVNSYIIDTGINYGHTEFGGRATPGFDAFGGNGSDCNGHGTHVAGTVGGNIYGVAKESNLVAVRVLDCNGSGTSSGVIAGIDWVIQNHISPSVANLSLGGGASASLDSAINSLINSGVATVLAAGNENVDACGSSPARVPAAMTIGASGSNDARASFSNFGNCVDWFAPGVNITSAHHTSSTALVGMSGTSMAAPHVAGAAALYLEHYPTSSHTQVRDGLYARSTKSVVTSSLSANNHMLYAFDSSTTPDPVVITPPPAPADVTAPVLSITSPANGAIVPRRSTISIRATATDNVAMAKVEFRVAGSLVCVDSTSPYSCSWYVPYSRSKIYQISTKAFDKAGNTSTRTISVKSSYY